MSTYLNAYAISDFVYSSNEATKTPDQVLQRIFVRPGEQDKTTFALESSEKLLHELEDYVSMTYDLEKLDSIAVPGKVSEYILLNIYNSFLNITISF